VSRGRLLFPYLAEIAQLDTEATAADPDGAGPLTSGYDADFQEPVAFEGAGEGSRVESRKESTVFVPCQIETLSSDRLEQFASGNSPDSGVIVTFHFRDLERLGLVEDSGVAKLRVNDRLVSVREFCSGKTGSDSPVVQEFPNPPGLYLTHPRPSGWKGRRNLLVCTFEDRQQSARVSA
jgi:hypothetical protein